MEKTTVFNLIILDESGSMDPLRRQTIDGCNETLNTIRSLQEKNGETQRYLASIYVFQSNAQNPSHYIIKNAPIGKVSNINGDSYSPWGGTPLLDAVGSTLVDLRAVAATQEDATGVVTIITDGMENSSTDYSWEKVASLISELKKLGWTFNFIGANIDVEAVSKKMNIDNAMAFQASQAGTRQMWCGFSKAMTAHEDARIADELACDSIEERIASRITHSTNFFED